MMFVQGPTSFYVLRFLLGVAEAGFLPGIIYYLGNWYPAADRARAVSWFMVAIPLASVVGQPLSGLLLELDGWHGLEGWQWLFLLEGLPAVVLGFVVLCVSHRFARQGQVARAGGAPVAHGAHPRRAPSDGGAPRYRLARGADSPDRLAARADSLRLPNR